MASDEKDPKWIEKLTRAPARHVFYVDVGKMTKEEAQAYLKEAKKRLRGK